MTKRTKITGVLIATSLMVLLITAGYAATFPAYERLLKIDSLSAPNKVAVDAAGTIYIAEIPDHRVAIYSSGGVQTGSIILDPQSPATALKATDSGTLYVGHRGGISIYNGNTLVNTVGDISLPAAIDVDSGGKIFVLDAGAFNVKIFDSAGTILSVIGDFQVFGSDLRDLVVDEANSEFYVVDRAEPFDDNGTTVYVWRVQVFDLSGNLQRSFSHFAYATEGSLVSVSSIAVDDERRVYLADNVQNIIGVYDHLGNHLGTMYDNADPYHNPVNITYRNNRLYYVSLLGETVAVLGIDGYANLEVNPEQLNLDAQGSGTSGDTTITLSNTGPGQLDWTSSSDSAWLTLTATSGSIAGRLTDTVDVLVNAEGLSEGQHTGHVLFESNGGSSGVTVALSVQSPAVLSVEPSTFDVQADEGEAVTQSVNIALTNDLSGTMTWQAVSDSGWLSIAPDSGSSNTTTTANVLIDTTGLAGGSYSGTIAVTSDGAEGSPASVAVRLEVLAVLNTINVTTNHPDATFAVTGAETHEGSGTNWTARVADGQYTIVYGDVPHFMAPPTETKSVSGGSTITFTGTYTQIRPEDILASDISGKTAPNTIRVFDGDGSQVNEITVFPDKEGTIDVAAGDIDGDGLKEIIAGLSGGYLVGVFDPRTGVELMREGRVGRAKGNSYSVEADDLDGDGTAEVIVSKNNYRIRVIDVVGGGFAETGINFSAYSHIATATMSVTAGDVDGDGLNEIVAVVGINKDEWVSVLRVWSVDTWGGAGNWTESLQLDVPVALADAVSVAVDDRDGDGKGEILIANAGQVVVVTGQGVQTDALIPGGGVIKDIAAGDVNGDGISELVVGYDDGSVRAYNGNGTEVSGFGAFTTSKGVRVSTGDLGYQGGSN